jgi:hypothetical protein
MCKQGHGGSGFAGPPVSPLGEARSAQGGQLSY